MKNNSKIVYIREDNRIYVRIIDLIIKYICKLFLIIRYERVSSVDLIVIPKLKSYNKLIVKIIIKKIKRILKNKEQYYIAFDDKTVELKKYFDKDIVLDGKYFMKHYVIDILIYIFNSNLQNMSLENIYVFVNNYSKLNIYLINKMVGKFKTVNIITENLKKFKKLENEFYKEGILITVSNNKRKSAINAKYIVNIDFGKDLFRKYRINQKSIIVNCIEEKDIYTNDFNGIEINNLNVIIDENNSQYINEFYGNMNKTIFLESCLLIGNDYVEKIDLIKKLYNAEIGELLGVRGIINKKEILDFFR